MKDAKDEPPKRIQKREPCFHRGDLFFSDEGTHPMDAKGAALNKVLHELKEKIDRYLHDARCFFSYEPRSHRHSTYEKNPLLGNSLESLTADAQEFFHRLNALHCMLPPPAWVADYRRINGSWVRYDGEDWNPVTETDELTILDSLDRLYFSTLEFVAMDGEEVKDHEEQGKTP